MRVCCWPAVERACWIAHSRSRWRARVNTARPLGWPPARSPSLHARQHQPRERAAQFDPMRRPPVVHGRASLAIERWARAEGRVVISGRKPGWPTPRSQAWRPRRLASRPRDSPWPAKRLAARPREAAAISLWGQVSVQVGPQRARPFRPPPSLPGTLFARLAFLVQRAGPPWLRSEGREPSGQRNAK